MLLLEEQMRSKLWQRVIEAIERYFTKVDELPFGTEIDPAEVRAFVESVDFTRPIDPIEAIAIVEEGLWKYQLHVRHPRYFGLFDPASTTMGVAADALVAAFNPQLAAWIASPFAIEVEQHLVRALGARFGYDPSQTDGTFTTGGAEANHTAVLTALTQAFPDFAEKGLRALPTQPVLYTSTEGHPSVFKACRLSGLGTDALRKIPVDDHLRMEPDALSLAIARDRAKGLAPFMVVATVGSTSAGAVDPIARIADAASKEGIWLHVDAAWGGAAALVPELRPVLDGIERADSITFDPHKWLSVPMGAGLYLTRHEDVLGRTFHVTTAYIPRTAIRLINPYMHSIQWSRRFIGLKVFLSLAVAGWDGYAAVLRRQVAMGELLRRQLNASGWDVVNDTRLPLVCFVDGRHPDGRSAGYLEAVAEQVVSSGEARIFTTRLGNGRPALRACITNYRTAPKDVEMLVNALNRARDEVGTGTGQR